MRSVNTNRVTTSSTSNRSSFVVVFNAAAHRVDRFCCSICPKYTKAIQSALLYPYAKRHFCLLDLHRAQPLLCYLVSKQTIAAICVIVFWRRQTSETISNRSGVMWTEKNWPQDEQGKRLGHKTRHVISFGADSTHCVRTVICVAQETVVAQRIGTDISGLLIRNPIARIWNELYST